MILRKFSLFILTIVIVLIAPSPSYANHAGGACDNTVTIDGFQHVCPGTWRSPYSGAVDDEYTCQSSPSQISTSCPILTCYYSEKRVDGDYQCPGAQTASGTCESNPVVGHNCNKVSSSAIEGQTGDTDRGFGTTGGGSFFDVFGSITPPRQLDSLIKRGGDSGAGALTAFLNNLIAMIYMLIGFIFLFMMIFGAFQWITSGGDKESVAKARSRITNAIIGLAILALAFFLTSFIGQLFGFRFFR